jgi:hypothetical protein
MGGTRHCLTVVGAARVVEASMRSKSRLGGAFPCMNAGFACKQVS